MLKYLNVIGWSHTVLGALGTAMGVLTVTVPVLMLLYGLYDFVYGLVYLMVGPQYIPYALESLLSVVLLCAAIAVPAVVWLAAFSAELYAGIGILRRWPRARIAGFVACLPALLMGLPGMILGVGTLMVLNDDEVKASLA